MSLPEPPPVASLATRAYWNVFTLWHARREARLPYRPLAALQDIQSRRVREIVGHAWRHTPFYRDAMRERGLTPDDFQTAADLSRLPLIDGHAVAARPERFLSGQAAAGSGISLQSSGTSGSAKLIRYDARALFLALAHGHRQRHVFAHFVGALHGYREVVYIRPRGVAVQIRGFYEAHSWTPPWIDLQRTILTPGELTAAETAAELSRLRPDLLCGYGSHLGALFRQFRRENLAPHLPKVIQYGADCMPEADRRLIEDEFGVPVISTYQAAEALRIGFECERRMGLHVSIDAVAVRIVDDNGREVPPGRRGHVVVSNLTNYGAVLLNYRIGDVAASVEGDCPCGRSLPRITNIEGRGDDLLVLPRGRLVHGLVAVTALQAVPGVRQVQIVQRAEDEFLLRVAPEPSAFPDADRLAEAFRAGVSFPAAAGHVRVEPVDAIEAGPSGKVRAVVSELDGAA